MRKLILVLYITLLSCFLTGCAFNDFLAAMDEQKNENVMEHDVNSIFNKIQNTLASGTYTQATAELGYKASDAAEKYKEVYTEDYKSGHRGFFETIGDLFEYRTLSKEKKHEIRVERAKADMEAADAAFDAAEATDPLRLAELKDAKEAKDSKSIKNRVKDPKVLIIVGVVIVILLLFFMLNKRSPAPRRVPVQPYVAVGVHSGAPPRNRIGQLNANKMNACRKIAAKYGLDADKELVKYNGDVDRLYNSLVAMQPLGD